MEQMDDEQTEDESLHVEKIVDFADSHTGKCDKLVKHDLHSEENPAR